MSAPDMWEAKYAPNSSSETTVEEKEGMAKALKLDGVAPLMTDPPPTNSTTLQSLPYYGFERTLQDNNKNLAQ